MRSSKLRHIVDIEKLTESKTVEGLVKKVWVKTDSFRAEYAESSRSEQDETHFKSSKTGVMLKTRYFDLPDYKYRLKLNGAPLDVVRAENVGQLNKELIFYCDEFK